MAFNKRVNSRKLRAQIKKTLKEIPKELTKRGESPYKDVFYGTLAYHLFDFIYEAFLAKSDGDADSLGNTWQDLTRRHKAYGKSNRGALTKHQRAKLNNRDTVGLLTPTQLTTWRKIYSGVLRSNAKRLGTGPEGQALAAKVAWARIKEQGAETMLEVLGDREIAIMRETDTLLNSYKPGRLTTRKYWPRKNQIYNTNKSGLEMGSSVPYALTQHEMKDRKIIPDELGFWLDESIEYASEALAEYIARQVR